MYSKSLVGVEGGYCSRQTFFVHVALLLPSITQCTWLWCIGEFPLYTRHWIWIKCLENQDLLLSLGLKCSSDIEKFFSNFVRFSPGMTISLGSPDSQLFIFSLLGSGLSDMTRLLKILYCRQEGNLQQKVCLLQYLANRAYLFGCPPRFQFYAFSFHHSKQGAIGHFFPQDHRRQLGFVDITLLTCLRIIDSCSVSSTSHNFGL